MNKRGMTPFGIIIVDIVFIIIYAMFASGIFKEYGLLAVTNGATGVSAFLFSNINFVVIVCFILANVAYLYFASQ